MLDAWAAYHVSETRHLDSQPTSTEPTFYPVTKTLLSAILKEGQVPFEVRVNTSETKGKAHDMPDFVLGDDKMFRRFVHVSERAAFRCDSGERRRWASLM